MEREISQAVIRRMPRYYRYLDDLLHSNVERISSNELSEMMHVTASQIRQDLNNFGGFGQQGYGYNVKSLHSEIAKILGLEELHPMILIGTGNLGQAIASYVDFEKLSFQMVGLFDVSPEKIGKQVSGITVQSMEALPGFLRHHHVDIAALTIPREAAPEVANHLVELGIRAIWNFAHTDLELPASVVVQNVHLSDSLMQLSYNMENRI